MSAEILKKNLLFYIRFNEFFYYILKIRNITIKYIFNFHPQIPLLKLFVVDILYNNFNIIPKK